MEALTLYDGIVSVDKCMMVMFQLTLYDGNVSVDLVRL